MDNEFEICFNDLKDETQKRLLEFYMTKPEEENWDVFPIASLSQRDEVDNK